MTEQVAPHMTRPMTQQPVLAVRGEAINEVEPELATFTVRVSARDADRATTLRRLTKRSDEVRAILDGYGDAIERRETSSVNVYPENKGRGERVKAYLGSISTTVAMTDFVLLGEVMLRFADAEQTSVHGPQWSLRQSSPVYAQTRRAAVAEAIGRARDYADALGARVTGVVELADAGLSSRGDMEPPRMYRSLAVGMAPGGAAEPQLNLDPEQQTVRATVEARFLISEPTVLSQGA